MNGRENYYYQAKHHPSQESIEADQAQAAAWREKNKHKVKHGPLVTVDHELTQPKRSSLKDVLN